MITNSVHDVPAPQVMTLVDKRVIENGIRIITCYLTSYTWQIMDIANLGKISVANITKICKRHMQLSSLDCKSRANLYSAISGQHNTVQGAINVEISNAIRSGITKYGKRSRETESGQGPSKRQRRSQKVVNQIEANGEDHTTDKERVHPHQIQESKFNQPPTRSWMQHQAI